MNPLKTVLVMAACAAGPSWATAAPQPLPWQREISLREAAQSTALQGTLNPTDPGRSAMSINNLKMHTVIWGPPDRITISVTKNDVWDRRLHDFPAPTLQEITEGAFSPANKDYVGVKEIDSVTFALVDIAGPSSLAEKLAKKSDSLSVWLSERLDEGTTTSLAALQASKPNYPLERVFLTNLVDCLNAVIAGPSLFEEKRFQGVRLRPETEGLRQADPQGREVVRLNRLLLADAYPKELAYQDGYVGLTSQFAAMLASF